MGLLPKLVADTCRILAGWMGCICTKKLGGQEKC